MIEFLGRRGRLVVALILLAALGSVLLFLHEILFPFLLAGFLSYVLSPVIERIHLWEIRRFHISRGLAVIMVYLLILLALIGGGTYLLPRVTAEMGRLIEEFPRAVTTLTRQWIPEINRKLNEWASLMPEAPEPVVNVSPAPGIEVSLHDVPITILGELVEDHSATASRVAVTTEAA